MLEKHLSPQALSARWHLSPLTLRQWRWKGWGPLYLKLNRRIVYRLKDIEAYEDQHKSTPLSHEEAFAFCHNEDFSRIQVGRQTFLFRDVVQKRIIETLYREWQRGHPKVRTQVLLEESEAKSQQLTQIFKRHPNWKQIVGYKNGACWLKIPKTSP